ncbi:MAG: heme ABC transporter ATP-binding protein [Pyrinomonadaceae bacterium]
MLEAKDLTFSVGSRELVSSVSAAFEPGKLHLIIGPNGAGKSTLIKLLARSIRPKSGIVEYEGKDVSRTSDGDLAKIRAVLSQAIEVAFPLTVREIVMMGRYPHFGGRPRRVDEEIVDEISEFFEITEFSSRNYQTLSGGERQRVNFARVLGQLWRPDDERCRYLFLDEPLTFLDINHQIAFMKKIRDFTKGENVVTVGVVHDLNLAARFADKILLLDEGRIVAGGDPESVLTGELIKKVFGVEPILVPIENHGMHLVFD